MSDQVTSRLKVMVDCKVDGCGLEDCTAYGVAKRNGHVRGCTSRCPQCRGARNRSKGDSKARRGRKILGLAGANTRHEEHWGGSSLTEFKAGAKANVVQTQYDNSRAQSDASRAIGDNRPFVAGFCPDGTKHVLFVVRDDDLEAFVFGLAEQWGFGEAG